MAFDKNQLFMHQLQVKAKRLESGLLELVGALITHIPEGSIPKDVVDAYDYALGCLGGDYLKKDLFEKDSFGRVVERLMDSKFMRSDIAEKNLSVWKQKHVPSADADSQIHSTSVMDNVEKASDTVVADSNVEGSNAEDVGSTVADDTQIKTFGTVDENGNVVPVIREQKCEYAEAPHVETKSGLQPDGIRADGENRRGPIYCY